MTNKAVKSSSLLSDDLYDIAMQIEQMNIKIEQLVACRDELLDRQRCIKEELARRRSNDSFRNLQVAERAKMDLLREVIDI